MLLKGVGGGAVWGREIEGAVSLRKREVSTVVTATHHSLWILETNVLCNCVIDGPHQRVMAIEKMVPRPKDGPWVRSE